GDRSFGASMATSMRNVAVDVTGAVVPDAGHWIMEENPTPAVELIRDFLSIRQRKAADRRLISSEYDTAGSIAGATGTSSVHGIRTVVLKGDQLRGALHNPVVCAG